MFLALALLAFQDSSSPTALVPAPEALLEVRLANGAEGLAQLRAADFDVVWVAPEGGRVQVVGDAEERARLAAAGFEAVVVHEDLVAHYASRLSNEAARAAGPAALGAWLSPPFGQGSQGGYYEWAEVVSVLDQIAAAYPALTTSKFSLGQSLEGRDLWAIKLSDNPGVDENEPEVRFDAMHHAREPESMQALLWAFLHLVENYGTDPLATWIVDNREIWFVPVVNPDGYVFNQVNTPGGGGLWRKNRRDNGDSTFGVDINRNYTFGWGTDNEGSSPSTFSETYRGTAPASEPEIQAMEAFMVARDFRTALSVHTFSNLWLYPWGYVAGTSPDEAAFAELAGLATEANGYVAGPVSLVLYLANGGTNDHEYALHDTLSFTPEIGGDGDGFWPATNRIVPLAEENLPGFLSTALAAGSFVRVPSESRTEVGNGDGYFDPAETIELRLTVRNSGRSATATPVTVTLTSASPDVTLGNASHDFGTLGSFAEANNAATPLTLTIDGAPQAGALAYTLTVAWDGFVETMTRTVGIGAPRPFLTDDVEVDLGWIVGLAGDTAATGTWEFGDPVGTSGAFGPMNPEDDATPGGVNCFTTGNGGTGAGDDDVDGGITTLITPALDLEDVDGAIVSYSRWYANDDGDDLFEVSISNDDGATWVELEGVLGLENAWTQRSFAVEDFVPATSTVRLRFVAQDEPNNSITEAAVDELLVETFGSAPRFNLYGRPALGTPVAVHVTGTAGDPYVTYWSLNPASFTLPFIDGTILLFPPLGRFTTGLVGTGGLGRELVTLPNDPSLLAVELHFQALVLHGGALVVTNKDELVFE